MVNHSTPPVDSSGWSASLYNKNASYVYSAGYTNAVLQLLDAKPGEYILDLGCGSGELTLQITERVGNEGLVVGVDLSESMLDRAKANGVRHAFRSDIQRLEIPDSHSWIRDVKFDAVFSNASLHWCKCSPMGVLEGAKRVLKPGGRFVSEMGGFMNCIGIRSALHNVLIRRGYDPVALDPWYFPSVDEYEKLLISAGFEVTYISLIPRPTPLPEGLAGWLEVFVRSSFLKDFDDATVQSIIDEVVSMCAVDCKDEAGKWSMFYMRLRFSAFLK